MRKAMDAEQRERMLYLAGSGHSSFLLSSDRVCSKCPSENILNHMNRL